MSRFIRSAVVGLALASSSACFDAPEEDAGDAAFVTQAVTTVLGRRPHSVHEVYALQTLEGDLGREAVLRVLMEQPEFVDYWADVLMDDLLVFREGNEQAGDTTCYTETHLDRSDHDDLVEHLRFRTWRTPFCPSDDGLGWSTKVPSKSASKSRAPDTSTWMIDPNAPDDRTRSEVARDDEIQRYLDAGDVESVQALIASEAAAGGEVLQPAMGAVEVLLVEGLDVGDDPSIGEAFEVEAKVVNGKGDCEQRFTMADVLHASLTQDRLDVLYRASIAPQATFSAVSSDRRSASNFTASYLNRDLTCVACHSSHYSTTSATPRNDEWDRFEPAHRVALETNVFSFTDADGWHDGSLGGGDAYNKIVGLYRQSQWDDEGGLQPFGMDPSCGVFSSGSIDRDGFLDPANQEPTNGSLAGYEGIGVLDMMDLFASGVNELDWYATQAAPSPDYGEPWADDSFVACSGCHEGVGAPAFETNAYTMPPSRIHQIVSEGPPTGGNMPALGPDLAAGVTAHFVELGIYRPVSQYVLPETAVAHLTAMKIVDNVFEEISGGRLTTDTGFPRNAAAASTLDHLTKVFVDEGWSLRALLVEILTTTHVNRVAPADSTLEGYPLPMVVNPFTDVNELVTPVGPGDDANGQGDLVHRWSVRSLLRQVQHGLDWPAPPIYPGAATGSYAHRDFQRDLGARMNRRDLGFWEHDLPASLAWELEIGTCRNNAVGYDFIDELTSETSELNLGEAMLAVKERLLTSPEWWGSDPSTTVGTVGGTSTSEYSFAQQLTANNNLTDAANSDPEAVRDYCAALLMSPQFLLAGLPVDVPNVDSFIPCERGAVCSHDDYCEQFAATAGLLGLGDADCSPYNDTIGWSSR